MTQTIDLTAQSIEVIVTRGDAWSLGLRFPRSLTGATIASHLRARAGGDDFIDMAPTTPTADPDDASKALFYIGQPAATISGVIDVQVTETGAGPRTYWRFTLRVVPDVTRAA